MEILIQSLQTHVSNSRTMAILIQSIQTHVSNGYLNTLNTRVQSHYR